MKTLKVYVFFAEGFEEVEALTPVDVLRRADFSVEMVSITGVREVTGARGITVCTDVLIESISVENADILILPGGMPGAINLSKSVLLSEMLVSHNSYGKCIAAICAAPFILGDLGLLYDKSATCYPGYEEQLKGASCKTDAVVVSNNIITSNGVGAAMEFSLAIVAKFCGVDYTKDLAKKMMTNF